MIKYKETFLFQYSALSLSLPQNVNLMTMEPWKENSILVRFEHILEVNEDPEYSKPAMFNLKDVFHNFDISEIRETTLAANQWKDEATRMAFRIDDEQSGDMSDNSADLPELDKITVLLKENEGRLNDDNTVPRYIRNRSVGADTAKDTWNIFLQPMEIRTFVLTLEWRP